MKKQTGLPPIDIADQNQKDWKWDNQTSPSQIFDYFGYICGLMNWFSVDGKILLKREEPLSHEEWFPLFKKAFKLWNQMSPNQPIDFLFLQVISKGVFSISRLVGGEMTKNLGLPEIEPLSQKYHDWLWQIEYNLQPGARLGIGSHSCRDWESRALIERLALVARDLKYEHLLKNLASDRFPGDECGQQMFMKSFKDWLS
jgi:hypothetical protein